MKITNKCDDKKSDQTATYVDWTRDKEHLEQVLSDDVNVGTQTPPEVADRVLSPGFSCGRVQIEQQKVDAVEHLLGDVLQLNPLLSAEGDHLE